MSDLRGLPRNAAVRKINELIKRARLAKVHALVIAHLRSKMPSLWGKGSKQKKLLEGIVDEFKETMEEEFRFQTSTTKSCLLLLLEHNHLCAYL